MTRNGWGKSAQWKRKKSATERSRAEGEGGKRSQGKKYIKGENWKVWKTGKRRGKQFGKRGKGGGKQLKRARIVLKIKIKNRSKQRNKQKFLPKRLIFIWKRFIRTELVPLGKFSNFMIILLIMYEHIRISFLTQC